MRSTTNQASPESPGIHKHARESFVQKLPHDKPTHRFHMRTSRFSGWLVVALLTLVERSSYGDSPWYSVTDLGTLGGDSSWAYGISDRGQVVGHSLVSDPSQGGHSFLYTGRSRIDLYPFDAGFSWAGKYINNLGQIAGSTQVGDVLHPALYGLSAEITVLPTLGFGCGGYCTGTATAINNSGQAVGWSSISDNLYHAVLWENGTVTDLGSFGAWSYASSINDSGNVIGLSAYERSNSEPDWIQHPFLYTGGNLIDLTQFGIESAVDINNRNQIIGTLQRADGMRHAALVSGGGTTDIHRLGLESDAAAINEHGQIVGSFRFASGVDSYYDFIQQKWIEFVVYSYHPYVYQDGVMADLNNLVFAGTGWQMEYATDINNAGQIVGWGRHNGELRGFLLSPAIRVDIDIKPKDFPNVVNPKSTGLIPVAILTTASFDAAKVDVTSVLFGVEGTEVAASTSVMDDVNKDKRPDLLMHFRTDLSGIKLGDKFAILTGRTRAGLKVTGQDSIRTTPNQLPK